LRLSDRLMPWADNYSVGPTNFRAAGLAGTALNHEAVLTIAAAQSTRLADLLERFLAAVDSGT
jgi:hypothetical protein